MRADIFAAFDTAQHAPIAFDIVTASPRFTSTSNPDDADEVGTAARRSSKNKLNKYAKRWETTGNSLKVIPISIELSGYIDRDDKARIRKFFQTLFPSPSPSTALSTTAIDYTRKTLQTISHSLHWTQGRVLAEYRDETRLPPPGSPPGAATNAGLTVLHEAGGTPPHVAHPGPHGAVGAAHGAATGAHPSP
jgi:hypothetical protein